MRKPEDLHETGQSCQRVIGIGDKADPYDYLDAEKTDCGIFTAVFVLFSAKI